MPVLANFVRPKGDPQIIETGPSSVYPEDRLAKSLGWFSVGLGLAEVFATRRLTKALGLSGSESLLRAFGARELVSGVTTLSTEKETGLWSRVVGDTMDLVVLSNGLSRFNTQRGNVKLAMMAVAGVTALDILAASSVTARKRRAHQPRLYNDRTGFPKGLQSARRIAENRMAAER
jgi:hypothetical protein